MRSKLDGRLLAVRLHLGADVVLGVLHLLAPHAEAVDEHGERAEHAGDADEASGVVAGGEGRAPRLHRLQRAEPGDGGEQRDAHGSAR